MASRIASSRSAIHHSPRNAAIATHRLASFSRVVKKHNRNAIPGIPSGGLWRLVPKRHDSDVAVYEVKMRLEIFANQIRASSRRHKLLIRRSRTGVTLDDHQMIRQ